MGKPYGLGAIATTYELRLHTRGQAKAEDAEGSGEKPRGRYTALFTATGVAWETGERTPDVKEEQCFVNAFERYILQNIEPSKTPFQDLPRIVQLLTLLQWPGPSSPNEPTRYMEIERIDEQTGRKNNEYTGRPVLPVPTRFGRPDVTALHPPVVTAAPPTGNPEQTVAPSETEAPMRRRGNTVDAIVLQMVRKKTIAKVRAQTDYDEELWIGPMSIVLFDTLQESKTIRCKVEEVDNRGRITRVTWKR